MSSPRLPAPTPAWPGASYVSDAGEYVAWRRVRVLPPRPTARPCAHPSCCTRFPLPGNAGPKNARRFILRAGVLRKPGPSRGHAALAGVSDKACKLMLRLTLALGVALAAFTILVNRYQTRALPQLNPVPSMQGDKR